MPLIITEALSFDRLLGTLEGLAAATDARTAYASADRLAKAHSDEITNAFKYAKEQEAIWTEKLEDADQQIAELKAALAAKPSDEDLMLIAAYWHGIVPKGFDFDAYYAARDRILDAYRPTPAEAQEAESDEPSDYTLNDDGGPLPAAEEEV